MGKSTKEKEINKDLWPVYSKSVKTNAPNGFNEKLWEKFESQMTQQKSKPISYIRTISYVASFLLIVAFSSLLFIREKNTNNIEAQLSEALQMFDQNAPGTSDQDIYYEDDLLIIYVDNSQN